MKRNLRAPTRRCDCEHDRAERKEHAGGDQRPAAAIVELRQHHAEDKKDQRGHKERQPRQPDILRTPIADEGEHQRGNAAAALFLFLLLLCFVKFIRRVNAFAGMHGERFRRDIRAEWDDVSQILPAIRAARIKRMLSAVRTDPLVAFSQDAALRAMLTRKTGFAVFAHVDKRRGPAGEAAANTLTDQRSAGSASFHIRIPFEVYLWVAVWMRSLERVIPCSVRAQGVRRRTPPASLPATRVHAPYTSRSTRAKTRR